MSVSERLQDVVDAAHSAYEAGPNTVNRKLNEVDKVLEAAVEAIQDLDESTSDAQARPAGAQGRSK